jgi:hypothetical protein
METGCACPLAQGAKGDLLVRLCHRELCIENTVFRNSTAGGPLTQFIRKNIFLLKGKKESGAYPPGAVSNEGVNQMKVSFTRTKLFSRTRI